MKKINVLQSWRAIFIVLICVEHSPLKSIIPVLAAGGEGVSFFLILSGFLAGYIYRQKAYDCSVKGSKEFVLRKLNKFYPLHIIAIILSIFLFSYNAIRSNGFDLMEIMLICIKGILNALFLQVYIPIREWYFNSIHGVGWFLSTIVFCYALTFAGLRIISKAKEKRRSILLYIAVLAIYVSLTQVFAGAKLEGFFLYIFPPVRYLEYFLAMIIGFNFEEDYRFITGNIGSNVMEFTALALWIGNHLLIKAKFYVIHINLKYIAMHIVSIALVYVFSKEKGLISKLLKNRLMVYIGNVSFYIYIMHQVIIRYVCQVVGWSIIGALVSAVVIVLYTLLISKYYDVIMKKLKGRG